MGIRSERTATGATVNRNTGNGRFAPKVHKTADKVSLNDFGRQHPSFILRDQDENPVAFDEDFCEKHGPTITRDMEKIAKPLNREHPKGLMSELLYELRSSYPVYQEDAGPEDYEVAVANLRTHLQHLAPLDAEEHVERITFGVHMEMEHRKDPYFTERNANDWADLTPPGAEFDDETYAHDHNTSEWERITDKAAVHASKSSGKN